MAVDCIDAEKPLYALRRRGESDVLIFHDRAEIVHGNIDGSNAVFELSSLLPQARTPDGLRDAMLRDGWTLVRGA